jgi:flagellar biosynthesis chaperone FliJ
MKVMNDNKVARWQILMDRVEGDLLQVQAALANITEKRNNLSDEAAKLNRMKVDYLEGFQRGSAEPQLKAKTVLIKDFVQHLEETLVSIAGEIEQIDKLRADIKSRYAELLGQFNKYKALKSRATLASRKEQLSLENKEQDMRNVLRFSEKST